MQDILKYQKNRIIITFNILKINNVYINDEKSFLVSFNRVKNIKGLIIKKLNLIINHISDNARV